MKNKRLFLWVILKIFTVLGMAVLLWVFSNSLFTNTQKYLETTDSEQLVTLDISAMRKGEIRKSYWNGKEVAVLYRKNPVSFHTKYIAKLPNDSLSSGSRSQKPDYFVYVNYGDSGNCPLFYSADTFKDICTGKLFNSSGRETNNKQQGYKMEIPPHYFIDGKVIFGIWSDL